MSIHPSFKSGKSKTQNSVLKRLERLLHLQKDEKWDEEKDSIFGLPKVRVQKLKFKKEKKEAAPEEGEAATAAAGAPVAGAETKDAKKKPEEKKKESKK